MNDDYSWLEESQPEASPSSASESARPRRFLPRLRRFLPRLRRFLPRLRRRARASASADQSSAIDLLGSQRERPLTELDQRLQALRARSLEVKQKNEWQELADIDQALTSPALQEKPGAVISAVALSQAQQAQVDLLTEIIAGQSEPDKAPSKRRLVRSAAQVLPSMSRLLTASLLLLFVALPFASSDYATGALPPADFAEDDAQARAYFTALDSLAPGDYVLVAVEYGLGAAAELDALTDLTLRHIFARGGRAILATSNPIAYLHAQNLINNIRDRAAQAGIRLVNGLDYLLLDYLPGGGLGIRELSENFADIARRSLRGVSTSLPINSLTGLKMLVLVADGADDVRNWVEQALPEAGTRRLYAATSLAAAPLTRAYVEDIDRFAGLVVGMRAAYTYGAMLDAALGVDAQSQPPRQNPDSALAPASAASGENPLTQPSAPADAASAARDEAQAAPSPTQLPTATPRPPHTPTPAPTDTPAPTATTAMLRIVEVTSPQSPVNIRVGPSTAQSTLGLAYRGDTLQVLDTNADSSWYKIVMSNGWEGWISAIVVSESLVPASTFNNDESASMPRERSVMSRFMPRRYGKIEPRFSQARQISNSSLGAIIQLRERSDEVPRLQALTMGTVAAVLAIVLGNLFAAIGALVRRG